MILKSLTEVFGIEIPRANSFISLLGKDFINTYFQTIPNYKLLLINSDLLPYQYSLDDLPSEYSSQINFFLDTKIDFKKAFLMDELRKSEFFNTIKSCAIRYSDNGNPADCAHLFYPWFFPKSIFTGEETISQQHSFQSSSRYLIPKIGVFADLIEKVEDLISKKDFNLIKNSEFELQKSSKIFPLEEKYIWASSSLPLLRNFEPKILKSLLINKRFVGVSIFKIDKIIFERWKKQFIHCPSEILILNKNFPNLSRISFPNHLFLNNEQYLMLEFISKSEQFISENQIKEITLWLKDIFKTTYFCDSRLLIYGYNPPLKTTQS